MLTKHDVAALADIPVTQLDGWIESGLIRPTVAGGRGRGKAHGFSLMATVGLLVAVRVMQSEHGCVLPFVGKVYDAFAATTEAELVKKFNKGRTHFVTVQEGHVWLQPKAFEWIDVKAAYHEVEQAWAQDVTTRTEKQASVAGVTG